MTSDRNEKLEMRDSSKDEDQRVFESVIEKVGGFNRWQFMYIFLAGLSCIITATNHGSYLFLAGTPKFRCANWSSDVNETTADACYIDSNKTTSCTEFIYDTSVYKSSLVTQWDLVCQKVFYLPVIQSSYFGGVILGDIIGGIASDAFGRRKTVLIICVVHMIFAYAAIFVRDYWLYIFVRLFIGGTSHAVFSILNVIIIELVSVRRRTIVQSMFSMGWRFGFGILALMGYLIRDWPYLQLAIALTNLVMITYFWIVPESPRWLLAAGREVEAEAVLRKIAKFNGTDQDSNFESEFRERWEKVVTTFATETVHIAGDKESKVTLWSTVHEILLQMKEIIHARVAMRTFLLLVWPWGMAGLANYGIFLSVKLVSVSKYSVVGITATVDILVMFLAVFPINKLGRVITMMLSFGIGGILGICIYFVQRYSLWATPILIIIGKAICSLNFLGTGLITREAFPTSVRNATVCLLDACSKIGAAVAPFIVDLLSIIDPGLPNLVIGALTVLAVLPFFFLPETANKDIPESIKDMNNLTRYSLVSKFKRRQKILPS